MSVDDFCRCSPPEFSAIATAWHQRQEQQNRQRWEQARMLCLCSLQPYTNKKMQPADVMQFPWDGNQEENNETTEEIWKKFEKAKAEQGLE